MGMFDNFSDIFNVLNADEELLRLLYYPPEDIVLGNPDPLDVSLPNVLSIDTDRTIRKDRIKKIVKVDDLTIEKPICRILMYAGRRSPSDKNSSYHVAEQQLIIEVFVHNSFEDGDLRSLRINDRLNQILVSRHITGMAKMEYVNGGQRDAPTEYLGYVNVYRFWGTKR